MRGSCGQAFKIARRQKIPAFSSLCLFRGNETEGLALVAKPSKLPGDMEGPGLELPGDKEFRPFLAFAYLGGVRLRAWLLWPSLNRKPF